MRIAAASVKSVSNWFKSTVDIVPPIGAGLLGEARKGMDPQDRRFMRRALALARKGTGLASPNPTVGCVIVKSGRIVGQGFHEYDSLDHAEARALIKAGSESLGATAYVTLEPCSHFGRTPPCAPRLIEEGVKRVVIAQIDPNPKVSGEGVNILRSRGLRVDTGIMAEEAERLNEPFACHVKSGRPLVVAKAAMSLDGKIATATRIDSNLSSGKAHRFTQSLRLELDALLVGVGTVIADDPTLTYRGTKPKRRPLIRVILDGQLRTPAKARVFQNCPSDPVVVFCREKYPEARRRRLEKVGAEVIPVHGGREGLDLERVLEELGRKQVLGVLVEGGGEIHWSFASTRLIDKLYLFVAPLILGGVAAVPAVGGAGFRTIKDAPRFKITRHFKLDGDLALEAYPSYSRSILSPWLRATTAPSERRCSSPP